MMKKIILLLGAAALCLAACEDYRDEYITPDSVYLRSADDSLMVSYSVYDAVNRIGVIKSGKGTKDCTVTLSIDNSLVGDYNYDHNANYVPLPKSLYNAADLDGMVVKMGADDARAMVEVKWTPADMVAEMTASPDKYVIPIRIKSATISVNEAKRILLVKPVMATVGPRALSNSVSCKQNSTATVKLGLVLSEQVDTKDVTVKLAFTPRAFTAGGIDYAAAPAGSVALRKDSVVIPSGDTEVDFQVDLDMKGVTADYIGGDIVITGVELRKTANADKARADESADEVLTIMPVSNPSMALLVKKSKK